MGRWWNGGSQQQAQRPQVGHVGPQGLPVNRTALAAGTTEIGDYSLTVVGRTTRILTLADLQALPQTTVNLPITCVEGWSVGASWSGVRLRDLLALVGEDGRRPVRIDSLEAKGRYRSSIVTSSRSSGSSTRSGWTTSPSPRTPRGSRSSRGPCARPASGA